MSREKASGRRAGGRRRCGRLRLLPLLSAALIGAMGWCAPKEALAAACCTSATVFGAGRLLVWEDAAAGLRLSGGRGLGQWDAPGVWRAYPAGFREHELRLEAWGIVRLARRTQLSLRTPWLGNLRSAGESSAFGHGFGDLQTGIRHELVSLGEYVELPAIAVTVGVLAPLGRRPEDSPLPLAVGATGRGAWELSLGVEIEESWGPWYARLEAGVRAPLAFTRTDLGVSQRFGPGGAVALSGGREVISNLVLGLMVSHDREARVNVDGAPVEGSAASSTSATAAASWRFHPHWTIQAAVTSAVLVDKLGANRPGLLTTTFGVRHGFF